MALLSSTILKKKRIRILFGLIYMIDLIGASPNYCTSPWPTQTDHKSL
jgi:hypothetical protein